MCGIAGALALRRGPTRLTDTTGRIVERIAGTMVHRGPGGSGLWQSPAGEVALAHRRLAIIDLSDAGRQPMSYEGHFWIAFNGEIYNFRELRAELDGRGCAFRGHNDTEVLLAAVAHWGIYEALRRATGMFALAVWDAREQVLHLARDRMREKPRYLGEIHGYLFFASELPALRAIAGFDTRIRPKATGAYLRDGCVPGTLSLYKGVYKPPPGHLLNLRALSGQGVTGAWPDLGDVSGSAPAALRRYFSCPEAAARGRERPITDASEAVDEADALLSDAVRAQMHADMPTGAFLSGGIDSSFVTAAMQHQSAQPVRTFTVAFDDPRFDESQRARAIDAHLGTQHEEFALREHDIIDQILSLVRHMD